jgi:uncharacterized protein (TIGR03435 family)
VRLIVVLRTTFFLFTVLPMSGQIPHPSEFEVASVRPVPPSVEFHQTVFSVRPGHFDAEFAALRQLAGVAYGIQRVRIVGGPELMDSDLYEVHARAESASATVDQVREMLQALLADRFKLTVHRETRQLPAYTLSLEKGGSKLVESKDPDAKPIVSPESRQGAVRISFQNVSIAGLVNTVANVLGNPVRDETGLTGRYNFTLEWTPPARLAAGDSGPSIEDAVWEQLGLRLEARKLATEVMVVDHAEKASEN